jgi:hypothetical protein
MQYMPFITNAFSLNVEIPTQKWGRRGRDRMVV